MSLIVPGLFLHHSADQNTKTHQSPSLKFLATIERQLTIMSRFKSLDSDSIITRCACIRLHALQVCLDAYVQRMENCLIKVEVYYSHSAFEEYMRDATKCMEEVAKLEKEVKEIAQIYPEFRPLAPL